MTVHATKPSRSETLVIGFDGDDTLWHNERIFALTQERFRSLLSRYVSAEKLDRCLLATEIRNLSVFGYGVKGFTLSMVETAIEVSEGRVAGAEVQEIINAGREMLSHPVELLPDAEETVRNLGRRYPLLLVTKGDLFDQESKIARSGLEACFRHIEVVSEKDVSAYRRILNRRGVAAHRFLMVGNSVRSDVLPVLALGGHAVHIPYHTTWAHEQVEVEDEHQNGYFRLERLRDLPNVVDQVIATLPKE